VSNCNKASTPADKSTPLQVSIDKGYQDFLSSGFPYQQAIDSLIYLAIATQPDISWIVSKLSQFLDKPAPSRVNAIKRLFCYIKGSKDYALVYEPYINGTLLFYTDSDWAGDVTDHRSTSGYIAIFGSAPISWKTRKQPTVALSSCEAEYISLTDGVKEALYLRRLLTSLGQELSNVTPIYCDNQ